MKSPVRVSITGAAGQIGYQLAFRIASGQLFGPDQPVVLQLLEIPPAMDALNGVAMELDDCAFDTLHGVVMSDDATTGFRDADHYQQIELARRALEIAVAIGKPGSAFVCKVFEGQEARDFQIEAQKHYKCRRIRPEAVRQNSREWFLVGTGKKTEPIPLPDRDEVAEAPQPEPTDANDDSVG